MTREIGRGKGKKKGRQGREVEGQRKGRVRKGGKREGQGGGKERRERKGRVRREGKEREKVYVTLVFQNVVAPLSKPPSRFMRPLVGWLRKSVAG